VKKTPRFVFRLALAVAAGLSWPPAAWAQQLAALEDLTISDSPVPVLTPTRMRQALRDVPASVTVLPAELLWTYGFLGITEAVRVIVGAGPTRLAGANYGLKLGKKATLGPGRVTLMVDGIEVGANLFADDEDWSAVPVSIDDVDRIEVTRGPGTAGYGDAMTMVIVNIVTRHPEDIERGYGRLSAGSNSTWRALGRAGLTLGPAALRLTLHHRERGTLDDERGTGTRPDPLSVDRLTIRTALRLDEGSTLSVDAAMLRARHEGDPASDPVLGPLEARAGYASAAWTRSLGAANELSLRLDHWADTEDALANTCAASTLAGAGAAGEGVAGDAADVRLGAASRPLAKKCDSSFQYERRTKLELQDTHVFSEQLRVVGGIGLRREQASLRTPAATEWSTTYRRAFAGVDWQPVPDLGVSGGVTADQASDTEHDVSVRAGVNWHLSDDQTLRAAWSTGHWASNERVLLAVPGNLITRQRVSSADIGYLLTVPASNVSVNARLFWARFSGSVWTGNDADSQADGEIYGAEIRGTADLSATTSAFLGLSTLTEGSNSGADKGHRPRPWTGGAGFASDLGDGWRLSGAYYASTRLGTSTQTAGRLDMTILKDFRFESLRARAALSARRVDHLPDPVDPTRRDGTAYSVMASLMVAY
jgi:iron complex outermembrane recepter protein